MSGGQDMGAFAMFGFIWLVMMIGMLIGWVMFLFAIWRGMRAHESIAESLRYMAVEMHRMNKPPIPPDTGV